tara:strand:+ start:313 stop:744 length:432 start_codon:yes stop_codon:yes gene_type:complete
MKKLIYLLLILSATSFAQNAKKMSKNLTVSTTSEFNKTASISFAHKNLEELKATGAFDKIVDAFNNAFLINFTVENNSQYVLIMDYKYYYSAGRYKMIYTNFSANIIDMDNNNKIVATIQYNGKFDLDALAKAISSKLYKTKT